MKIPNDIKQKVVALIANGTAIGEAANQCSVSYSSAYSWAVRAKVITQKSHKERMTIKTKDDIRIRELAAAGYSVKDMAAITGHTFQVVYQHLILRNIDFKRSKRGAPRGETTKQILAELRKGEKNFREIANQFGCSHQYISQLSVSNRTPKYIDKSTKIYQAKVMYEAGKTLDEIAAALDQDKNLIRTVLGIPRTYRTREQNIELVRKSNAYLHKHKTLKGCADQLGIKHGTLISLRTIYAQYVKYKDLPVPNLEGLPTHEKVAVYVRLGYRNKEIADLIHTSVANVANIVSRHNLRPANKSTKAMPKHQIPDIIKYVRDCYKDGIPISEVLEIMNINVSTFCAWERKSTC